MKNKIKTIKAGEDLFEGDIIVIKDNMAYRADRRVYSRDELAAMILKNGCSTTVK